MNKKPSGLKSETPKRTPTFLLELPLQVRGQQAKHLRGHFEAARQLYNALLCEALKRLRRMRADQGWQQARLIPRSEPQARKAAFTTLRQAHGFTEYALHLFATRANTSWLATHLDANTAQTLATRAYRAANRVCVGKARRVRFKSKGRGLDSLEGYDQRSKPIVTERALKVKPGRMERRGPLVRRKKKEGAAMPATIDPFASATTLLRAMRQGEVSAVDLLDLVEIIWGRL